MESMRFVIITVPQQDVIERIDAFRRHVSRITDSVSALAYPPHVTLRTGAAVPLCELDTFVNQFRDHIGEWQTFPIATKRFVTEPYRHEGETRYFIGYEMEEDDRLFALNGRLLEYAPYRKSRRKHFMPHLTVAFDDLDRRGFDRAIEHFANFPGSVPDGFSWDCANVSLYHSVNGRWIPYVHFTASAADRRPRQSTARYIA